MEQLENRLALAVDIVFGPSGAGEEWIAVVADEGSDIYIKKDATSRNELRIADNSSFVTNLDPIENIDDLDSIYVFHGQRVEQQVTFPREPGFDSNVGLLPTTYDSPGSEKLTFVLNTRTIELDESVSGTIALGDAGGGTFSFRNVDADGNGDFEENAWEVVVAGGGSGGGSVNVEFGSSGAFRTIIVGSAALATAGSVTMPMLNLNYSYESNDEVFSRVGLAQPSNEQTFQLFDPSTHQLIPGTLQGQVIVHFDSLDGNRTDQPIVFQSNTTGFGEVPLSFNNRASTGTFRATVFHGESDEEVHDETISISGEINTETGVLTLVTRTNGPDFDPRPPNARPSGPVSIPVYLDNVSFAVRDLTPLDDGTDILGSDYDVAANDLTLFPGATLTNNLIADLANAGSVIEIESPIQNTGRVSLSANTISVDSGIRAPDIFEIPGSLRSPFGTFSEQVHINASVGSGSFDLRIGDDIQTGNISRSKLRISQGASLSNLTNVSDNEPTTLPQADEVFVEVSGGDIYVEGRISADNHTYFMRSGVGSEVEGPYVFTTASSITGVQTGELVGSLLNMVLANDTLGQGFESYQTLVNTVDLETSVDRLRMQAGTRANHSADFPFPFDISIRETGDLIVDAVAASSGTIDIETAGDLSLVSSMNTVGGIKLQSGNELTLNSPISTSFGSIEITAPQVTVGSSVRVFGSHPDELKTDIAIEATEGQLVISDALAAVNGIELTAIGNFGGISGQGRIIADTVELNSSGDIVVRTDALGITARTPGVVRLDDISGAAFDVYDSPDVSITVHGLDAIKEIIEADGKTKKAVSPALYADITGALKLAVSAPQGGIDVRHRGTQTLEIGDGEAIAGSQDTGIGIMSAAGSVVIRSDSARAMTVSDAPTATADAIKVRFATAEPLPPNSVFSPSSMAGVYPTVLTTVLSMDSVDKTVANLDGVVATDIRLGDIILLKDGIATYSCAGVVGDEGTKIVTMPISFTESEASLVDKTIVGGSFAVGTKVVSYDEDSRELEVSQQLVVGVSADDEVSILDGDAHKTNGIYGVIGIEYLSDIQVEMTLRRSSAFDQTDELDGRRYVRVSDGSSNGTASSAGKVFASNGFANQDNNGDYPTQLFVDAVQSRSGFVLVNAMTTRVLPAEVLGNGDILATSNEYIANDTEYFDSVVLDTGRLVLVNQPLAGSSTTDHYGVYEVVESGDTNTKWRLARYDGIDEDGDGDINTFYTGIVALVQGTQRTGVTGLMYEVGYESINNAELPFEEITDFRNVATSEGGTYLTEEFNSVEQYRTDIGTDNVIGMVTYQVSSDAGTNEDPGSLGRILNLVQSNSAVITRLNLPQNAETRFHDSVERIQLTQELPVINLPIELVPPSEIIIDGSRIDRTRDGAVVRSGSVRNRLGPVSPSANPSLRRLVRGAGEELDFEQIDGLVFGPGAEGSVVGNFSIGGFTNGAAIKIDGASNILVNGVSLGIDRSGLAMPNKIGVQVDQVMNASQAEFTTVRNSVIASSTEAGVSLGTNVDNVRLVGNVIGMTMPNGIASGNEVGVVVDTGENGLSHIGVRRINPSAPVVGLPVTPIESYPGDIPGEVLPNVYDPVPTSKVSVGKNSGTDTFEPGLELFDRTADRKWIVRKIELSTDELYYVMTIKGPQIDEASFGTPLALEAGYFVNAPQRAETLMLPSGVDPARLYVGQQVGSTVAGVFEVGTYISSINVSPIAVPLNASQFGHYGVAVEIGLSRPVALTAQTGLLFQAPDRNIIGFNSDGIILKSGSSSIISTDVTSSNFDGIRIEGVGLKTESQTGDVPAPADPNPDQITNLTDTATLVVGMSVTGGDIPAGAKIASIDSATQITLSTPVIEGAGAQADLSFEIGGKHIIGGAKGIELSSESVTISANLGSGLSFTDAFFAGLANDALKTARMNQVKIQGNIFGTDLSSTPGLSNGRDGASNIVITDLPMRNIYQQRTVRDSNTGRYKAKYRPEDNPNQLEELEEFEGFDIEGNNHFTGDPITIVGPGPGFPGDDSDRPGMPTPPFMR
ncbi:hypothetical protein N9Z08_00910 [Pirellulales bacterium]|nr:hypothetical protein [Pirellulales bacterium]